MRPLSGWNWASRSSSACKTPCNCWKTVWWSLSIRNGVTFTTGKPKCFRERRQDMSIVTETRLAVRYQETDQMAIVYHTNYLVWFEIGRTDFVRQVTGRRYAEWE